MVLEGMIDIVLLKNNVTRVCFSVCAGKLDRKRKDNKNRGLDADIEGTVDFIDTRKVQLLSSRGQEAIL